MMLYSLMLLEVDPPLEIAGDFLLESTSFDFGLQIFL